MLGALADTNHEVQSKEAVYEFFATTIGTPHGYGLSPILFEQAIRDIWEALPLYVDHTILNNVCKWPLPMIQTSLEEAEKILPVVFCLYKA